VSLIAQRGPPLKAREKDIEVIETPDDRAQIIAILNSGFSEGDTGGCAWRSVVATATAMASATIP
jgi:hypothetical protein